MTDIHDFKQRHDVSMKDIAEILSVEISTVRKYMAPKTRSMHRALNPVAAALLDYIDARGLSLDLPIIRNRVDLDNAGFDAACGDRGNSEIATAISADRTTVYKWRRDLPVPATATKLVTLMNAFGWPEPKEASRLPLGAIRHVMNILP